MAKKVQKGKPAKKAVKPAKKAVAKKPAKKAPAKKVVKPAKKATAKKVVKKAVAKKVTKPVKKTVAKKPIKKVVAKKVIAKKVTPKKAVKPAKKVIVKKVTKKVEVKKIMKLVKKVVAKKPVKQIVSKKIVKPVKKEIVKPIAKKTAKVEVNKAVPVKPGKVEKPVPVASKKLTAAEKKKQAASIDMDDDESSNFVDAPVVIEYKTPSIRKPMGPAPEPHINTDKRTRYTDPELKEFKQLILKKLGEAQKDYELLKSTLSHRDDHGTDDTSPTFKLLEDGSDVLSKEETAHLASRQEKFIQNLQNALIRIENKTYGICRATGKLISKERLRSVPHATLAIEAKLVQKS